MAACIFIGDAVEAAGWRLAGVDARVAEPGAEAAVFSAALEEAPLVLVDAAVASLLPEPLLRAALRRLSPITVVMPDLQEQVSYPDVAARMKRQLGIEG